MPCPRPINEIAADIQAKWRPVNYAARPYLDAMFSLRTPEDMYGLDSGRSILAYFLSNAAQFKGPDAKVLKNEIRACLRGR
jgi:hypothetical protein